LPPAGAASFGPFALSPDGRQVAFVAYGDDGTARLWVRSLEQSEAHALPGTDDASLPFWSPDSRSLGFFSQRRLKRVELGGGPARLLTEVSDPRGGTWNRDNVIVYSPNPGDGLFRIPAEGGEPARLTRLDEGRAESSHRWPAFLGDGKRVVYLALSGDRERYGLMVVGLDDPAPKPLFGAESGAQWTAPGRLIFVRGQTLLAQEVDPASLAPRGAPLPLAEDVWRDPDLDGLSAFAANETVIAYRRGGAELTRLAWFDRSGRQLGSLGPPGLGSVAALSPDGRRIARSMTEQNATAAGLWLLDPEQGSTSRFTFNRWNDVYPVWSPGGRRIAFASDRTGAYNLFAKPTDGGEETQILRSEMWNFPEDWSPDGNLLAYTQRDPQTKGDVWLFDFTTGQPRPLLRGEPDELQPRISPDGRFFTYVSDASGRTEVYVETLPPTASKWQISTAGGFQPQWRRDGRELYYLAPDLRLMTVSVAAQGSTLSFGPPQALFLTRSRRSNLKGATGYIATPDGQRFLIDSQNEEDVSSPIHLLVDWQAEPQTGK
jgi:Tol biopolymer transport system component